jgi:hypothetical protein
MTQRDKKTETPIIVPTLHGKNGVANAKDIRQERLDELMKSFEHGFPGFYQALVALSQEHKSGSR